MLKKISMDTIVAFALVLTGIIWLGMCAELSEDSITSQYSKPSTYPMILAVLLIILSFSLIIRNLFLTKVAESNQKKGLDIKSFIPVILLIVLSLLYVSVVKIFGYIATTVVFLVATMLLFGERKILTLISVGIAVPLLLYIVFYYMLQVQLP